MTVPLAAEPTPPLDDPKPVWRRALDRFGFAYWLLFCSQVIPQIFDWLEGPLGKAWTELGLLVGHHLLGITDPIATKTTGSGDRTIDYCAVLALLILAVLAGGVWSMFDVRSRHDTRTRELVRVVIRYTLGFIMLAYGIAKMSTEHGQFSPPSVGRLEQPYGSSSPMGLLWTFMGASQAYSKFAGVAEMLGGALLLFRRTTLLGALVLVIAMANVVALNFCYDVPVKINSVHYLVMACALILPDLRRLVDVVVLRRAIAAPPPLPIRRFRGRRLPVLVAKLAVLVAFFVPMGLDTVSRFAANETAWYEGYWKVESFTRNGQLVPAIVDDNTRWQRLRFQALGDRMLVRWRFMDGSYGDLLVVTKSTERGFTFETEAKDKTVMTYTFALARADADRITITGKVGSDELSVTMHRMVAEHALLVNRGFHWISEVPFNR